MKAGFFNSSPYLRKPFIGALLAFWILTILSFFIGLSVLLWALQGIAIGVGTGILIADFAHYRSDTTEDVPKKEI